MRVLFLPGEARPAREKGENYRMSDNVLRAYVAQHIATRPTPVVEFVWQGAERNRSPENPVCQSEFSIETIGSPCGP